MAGRYIRKGGIVEAEYLSAGCPDQVLDFLGAGEHVYEPASGILSAQTRQGVVLNVRDGSYVVRDAEGHISHMPAEAFEAAFDPLFATGGVVTGPGGDDSVPALLEPGEAIPRSRRAPRSRPAAETGDDAGTEDEGGEP